MARDLTAGFLSAIQQQVVHVGFAVEMLFDSGAVRLWTGIGPITWNAQTWSGIGTLGTISGISENADLSAQGIRLGLSGIPSSLISLALTEKYRGRPVTIHVWIMDETFSNVLHSYQPWNGLMDTMTIDEGPESSALNLSCESELIDFERPAGTRLSHEEQIRRFPGDLFFQYTSTMAEVPLYWGIKGSGAVSQPPSHDNTPTRTPD